MAAGKRGLRAVGPDDAPVKAKKSSSVSQAAASGDHRELLVAMRTRIARAVSDPDCPPRDLAALTRRLQDIAKEIESIDQAARQEAEGVGSVEDDSFDISAI